MTFVVLSVREDDRYARLDEVHHLGKWLENKRRFDRVVAPVAAVRCTAGEFTSLSGVALGRVLLGDAARLFGGMGLDVRAQGLVFRHLSRLPAVRVVGVLCRWAEAVGSA